MPVSSRTVRAASWILPALACLAIYRDGLLCWFLIDDFAFLSLLPGLSGPRDLFDAVFLPTAHGTFRPFSERGFFLLFQSLFGLDALPFRICVFLTQFVNLGILSSIVRRLTGSALAGFAAPVFWIANSAMTTVMSWTSAYMQSLCALSILLAFHFLLRHVETGKRRYLVLEWAVFLFGFGVMESILVYPALAASYTFLFARRRFRATLPMFLPSAAFVVLHMTLVKKQAGGPYAMYFGGSLPGTFWTYWKAALVPRDQFYLTGLPPWIAFAGVAVLSLALLGFVAVRFAEKDRLPILFLGWFAMLLAPVLPLRDHVSEYYLTLPLVGLAVLAGYAFARAPRVPALVLAAGYLWLSVPAAHGGAAWWRSRGDAARRLVLGVEAAHKLHSGKIILLAGVTDKLFWDAVRHRPFAALGDVGVFLVPGSESLISSRPEAPGIAENFILSRAEVLRGIEGGKIAVYDAGADPIRNITQAYAASARNLFDRDIPRRVDVANPLLDHLLGAGWHPIHGGGRWMRKQASLSIGGPARTGSSLRLEGNCPPISFERGPVLLTVRVESTPEREFRIEKSNPSFEFELPLPDSLTGKPSIEIGLETARTVRSPDGKQEYGVVFGVFDVH
ncbi:MAG: hypothetical protein EXQ52_00635 [Bryobacterales bacterium]|nr:hypothetical protein [Bryobacterales bacterium]